jgi:hypothetical protein
MIEFRYVREKDLLLEYAASLDAPEIADVITRGRIDDAQQARRLARFYWRMVDASRGDDIEPWLERIHTTLFIACGNAGYADVWDEEVPA